jgi:pyruvate dehydrogenase E2 component (dihydrolipoamide acetyltransferase)
MPDVVMPRLSDAMDEGTILKWLVPSGTVVVRGQQIVEIETDKATETCEAEAEGALEIVAAEGETLPTGALIARIEANGAAAPATLAPAEATERATAKGQVTRVEPTRPQQVVARRAAESKATVPELTLRTDVDMDHAVALRAQLEALADPGQAVATYEDMVIKACGLALRETPRANAAWRDGRFELYGRVNVGVTVAAQDALIVPTVFDADQRPLPEIATTTRALADRARAGELTQPELSGGTFTVFSLGAHGVGSFSAVVPPAQAAILAVGVVAPRAVALGGTVVVRPTLTASLTCDHRILYGAEAAAFLGRIRTLLENPVGLV